MDELRKWRVFYTNHRAEKKCEERLAKKGVEVFLPTCEVQSVWKDRVKMISEPLFPNYIFARVDECQRLDVLKTQGIVRCLTFGSKLAEVTGEEIEQLMITQRDPSQVANVVAWVHSVGEQVEVTAGPFTGLRGVVLEQRGRIHVLIRIHAIRQAIKISIQQSWLNSLSDNSVDRGVYV